MAPTLTREQLEALNNRELLDAVRSAGMEPGSMNTREEMYAAILSGAIPAAAEPEVVFTKPVQSEEPEEITAAIAGLIVARAHEFEMSGTHESALATAVERILMFDGSLSPGEIDISTTSMAQLSTPIHAVSRISVPGARDCAKVIAAGDKGEKAHFVVEWARIKRRRFHLER